MAFPTVASITETVNTGSGAHVANCPATVNAGDYLCLFALASANITSVTGMTQKGDATLSSYAYDVWHKVADGTEDSAALAIGGVAAGQLGVYHIVRVTAGTWAGSLTNVGISTVVEGSSTTPDPGTVTPPNGAADNLAIAGAGIEEENGFSSGPSGYSGFDSGTDGVNSSAAVAWKEYQGATEDPGTFTFSSTADAWGAWTVSVPATPLPVLYPTSTLAAGGWTDEAGGTTDLHLLIDEVGAFGTDYMRTPTAATAAGSFGITDMPSDFVSMDTLSFEIRHSRGAVEAGDAGGGDDIWEVWAYIVDSTETVQLAGGNSTPHNGEQLNTSSIGYLAKTQTTDFTYVNTTATKAQWDGARLFVEGVYTATGGGDLDRVWVDTVRLVYGDYTAAAPAAEPVPELKTRPSWQVLFR